MLHTILTPMEFCPGYARAYYLYTCDGCGITDGLGVHEHLTDYPPTTWANCEPQHYCGSCWDARGHWKQRQAREAALLKAAKQPIK